MSLLRRLPGQPFAEIALLALGAVVVALISQHAYDMQPCPWCVLQRLVFVVIGVLALLAARWAPSRAIVAIEVVVFALAGAAAALWQHFVAAASASCNLTLADRIISGLGLDSLLPDVFQPRASCADGAVVLFGLSYEIWSLGLFILLGAMAVKAFLAPPLP